MPLLSVVDTFCTTDGELPLELDEELLLVLSSSLSTSFFARRGLSLTPPRRGLSLMPRLSILLLGGHALSHGFGAALPSVARARALAGWCRQHLAALGLGAGLAD